MRRVVLAVLLGTFGVLLWAPAPSFATGTYVAYVGCTSFGDAPPSHVCQIGDEPGAFFESPEEEVEYEVCVTFPEGTRECTDENEPAEPGILWVNRFTAEIPGNYVVSWKVEDLEVATWTFSMEPPPEPAPVVPPVTSPPPTTPAPTLPPPVTPTPPAHKKPKPKPHPSAACLKDKRTIKGLEKQFNEARSSKRRSAIQHLLKKARAAGAKAC